MAIELSMSELIKQLNDATKAYDEGHPIITDEEWDNLYFILQRLEQETGIIHADSPTQIIYYEIKNKLEKKTHNHKMLSLDKTKDFAVVKAFMKNQPCIIMSKMDGLTCSLRYENGKLVSAETRGDGIVGEDVTHNAKVLKSIPKRIPYKEELIIDGEVICTYDKFFEFAENFKNPRNFAAGSIRLLSSEECDKRHLDFVAWEVIKGLENTPLLSEKLTILKDFGFLTVPFITATDIDKSTIDVIQTLSQTLNYPIDGVVFKFDNIEYGKQQGETTHHFKNAIAYKFYDEAVETTLKDIEWGMGRTGVLTPVAVFNPIEIDGTIIERASLHNYSVLRDTLGSKPWVGQRIRVFKANMIIPQIEWAEEDDGTTKDYIDYPHICPVCGGETLVSFSDTGVINLFCTNPNCSGKLINRLDHLCGKKGLDIKGLSKATLEKLINIGWLSEPVDIFKLKDYKEYWIKQPGFGEKSVTKILDAIEESRNTTLEAFISALGIPLIGSHVAKDLCKHIDSYEQLKKMVKERFDFSTYAGFGLEKRDALLDFDYSDADKIYKELIINGSAAADLTDQDLAGKVFCITGRLQKFKNRDALVAEIEKRGGKVTGSVSSNTNYLINNDKTSTSAKNLSAKKLGIPIISENDFLENIDI